MNTAIKNIIRVVSLIICFSFVFTAMAARDWYVDQINGSNYYDGQTSGTAKQTIQAAVDSASSGDVIKVAEGIYQDVNTTYNGISACVIITNKNLTIVATGAKEKTHIVGRHAATDTGVGAGAVRCVYVKTDCGKTVRIEGFTIRDGATVTGNGGGVAFAVYDSDKKLERGWLIDCVVSNCVANRGGALWYGTAIRCLFTGNASGGSDNPYGQVASQSVLYNCLVVRNKGENRLFNVPRAIVNCTIAGNSLNNFCYVNKTANYIYNTIFLENQVKKLGEYAVLSNCLVTAGISGYNTSLSSGACATNTTGECFIAPAVGDWRPRSDSGAVALGDPAHLLRVNLPDESMRYVDFAGNPIPSEGPITCGAIQETATQQGGKLVFKGTVEIDGFGLAKKYDYCNYFYGTNYPCMYTMKAPDATVSNVLWYSCSTGLSIRVPSLVNNKVGIMPPPSGGIEIKPIKASTIIYADANNGDDDYEGADKGSYDHPYKTLQAAIEGTPEGTDNNNPKYSVICAKPGNYCKGGHSKSNANRLYIDGDRRVKIIALKGPEETIISGAEAAEFTDTPCRCIYMNVPSVVQGFTLTGGYTGENDITDEGGLNSGAVLFAGLGADNRIIADCIVSNNVSRFSIQRSGLSLRCKFFDNRVYGISGCDVRNGFAVYDILRYGVDSNSDSYTIGTGSKPYFSTYRGAVHGNAVLISCLAFAGTSASFIDPLTDDYRLRSDSPAFGSGSDDPEDYWKYANLDMMGNPLCFINNRTTSGAYQYPSAIALAVNPGTGMMAVNGSASITNAVMPGESVTITKAENCNRNLLGYKFDDGRFIESQTYTYTASEFVTPQQIDTITAVFSTNWYVDAGVKGNDSNDGYTPNTPKKTLKGIMTASVVAGDTVHAAPGEYDQLGMLHKKDFGYSQGEAIIESRVVVPEGVTLVADKGPDVTHIVGASASGEFDIGSGIGSNAVRCAAVSKGAKLKGFTLRDGRTNGKSGDTEDSMCAGGVLGASNASSYIEDCVISNCIAVQGGAGFQANFKRCRFFYNAATDRASVTRVSRHDSCIADWNYGTRPFDYFSLMTNCTIGANFFKSKTSNEKGFCLHQPVNEKNVYVFDCLILGKINTLVKMRRCAAVSANSNVPLEDCDDCILTNAVSLVIDETTYRPKIGENVAIDRISLSDDSEAVRTEKDLYGVQRVFNGARDFGALDADWRSHYAKTLGGSRITVVSADPSVVEENGVLKIPYGSVELTWRNPSDQMVTHLMGLAVYGGGVLSVLKDGEQFVNVNASASGIHSFRTSDTVAMSFTYNPDAEEDGYAEIGNLTARIGSRILIR